nr:hypothetical protein GCM10020092_095300 [Actinoplanes digitatis]
MQEVAALDLAPSDVRPEHERMIDRVRRPDLPHVGEVLENLDHRPQDDGHSRPPLVRRERDRAVKDDLVGEERDGGVDVPCFNSGAKRMHDHSHSQQIE